MLLSSEAKLLVTLALVVGLLYVLNSENKPIANKGVVNSSSSSVSAKTPSTKSTTKNTSSESAAPVKSESTADKKFDVNNYLPQETNKKWFETDFSVAKNKLDKKNLIVTDRYMVGVNTVGQSRGNANYDIRVAPPNPKVVVSPWLQSTIEYDYNQKSLL